VLRMGERAGQPAPFLSSPRMALTITLQGRVPQAAGRQFAPRLRGWQGGHGECVLDGRGLAVAVSELGDHQGPPCMLPADFGASVNWDLELTQPSGKIRVKGNSGIMRIETDLQWLVAIFAGCCSTCWLPTCLPCMYWQHLSSPTNPGHI